MVEKYIGCEVSGCLRTYGTVFYSIYPTKVNIGENFDICSLGTDQVTKTEE